MKKVVIVHCWSGYSQYCWYPETKKALEAQGFAVQVPTMPETAVPNLSLWLPKLQEVIGKPTEDTYLVGHSIGCITIMRYLETLSEKQKIGGVVFVAGFTANLDIREFTTFFEKPLDFFKIKTKIKHCVAIASDDDPYVPPKYAEILKENLGAEVIIKHAMKHFSGEAGNCTSLPDVANAIFVMVSKSGCALTQKSVYEDNI